MRSCRRLAEIVCGPVSRGWDCFWFPVLFLVATNTITNPYVYNLHNDALAQLLTVLGFHLLLVYLASPEPARVALESAFAPKPVLERWNDVLLRRSLQPQSAFLTNLERIVDDVMTRSE